MFAQYSVQLRGYLLRLLPPHGTDRVSAQGRAPSKSKGARPFGERPLSEGRAPVLIILMLFGPEIQKKSFFFKSIVDFLFLRVIVTLFLKCKTNKMMVGLNNKECLFTFRER